jgi:hypothetical protein
MIKLFENFNMLFDLINSIKSIDDIDNQVSLVNSFDKDLIYQLIPYLNDDIIKGVLIKNKKLDINKIPKKFHEFYLNILKNSRTDDEIIDDENIINYVFIGVKKFIPIDPKNENKGFKKELYIENLVPIDKFNMKSYKMIHLMKTRANIQYGNDSNEYGVLY